MTFKVLMRSYHFISFFSRGIYNEHDKGSARTRRTLRTLIIHFFFLLKQLKLVCIGAKIIRYSDMMTSYS